MLELHFSLDQDQSLKLRIRGNSIRLRLKQSEVAQVAAGESIVEETHFPGAVLTCRLDVSKTDDIEANFADGNLEISLPASKVPGWATTDEVSLTATRNTPDGATLTLLIEKDFSCLAPGHGQDHEDDADSFPQPGAMKIARPDGRERQGSVTYCEFSCR